MTYKELFSVLKISNDIIKTYVDEGMLVLDCTMGNGNDTLLLAERVGASGKVIAFDIQELALENTLNKLQANDLASRVSLVLDGHENIDKYVEKGVDFIIYNLGYLPKGDKSITTEINTTIQSLEKSLNLLKANGILLLVAYPGHKTGLEEKEVLEEYFRNIDQKKFNVLKNEFINQANNPPVLYCLEKSKKE